MIDTEKQAIESLGLFDFQRTCIEKLYKQRSRLIGDDMGLGKTYEGVALDVLNRSMAPQDKVYHTLVVTPLTVTSSWVDHYELLAPSLPVVLLDPKNRASFVESVRSAKRGSVFVMHWDALRLMPELQNFNWFHIIADEVHRAKSPKAQQTRALKKLRTHYKTGLSGTPADNRPYDLWSILNWLWPTYYKSYWKFFEHYCEYEIAYPQGYRKFKGVKNAESLHAEMEPWYIRRLKEEVLKDLPDKYNTDIWVDLSAQQRKAYDQMRKDMVAWVDEHKDTPVPLIASVVVAQLVRLQQFALGYATLVPDAKHDSGYRVALTDPSSKIDAVMQILEDSDESKQFVVFSQFKQAINLLDARLEAKSISRGILTGDTKQADRGPMVKDFQDGKLRVFAGTIAAGGVGITLTAASTVIFLDRAWSPALNRQAEDRLHRIGQKNAVQVIDIMARDTVDFGRRQLLIQKWEWIQEILGDKVNPQHLFEEEDDQDG